MRNRELIEMLRRWPDDTIIEISVSDDGEPVWYSISAVEEPDKELEHGLIYAGDVVMQ